MNSDDKHYSKHGMKEGNPGDIEPNEIGKKEPAKAISATEQLHINQSQLGRDQSQTPAEEHIDQFSQISGDSEKYSESAEQLLRKDFDTDDTERVDDRDTQKSSEDWDAEKNRTGRNK